MKINTNSNFYTIGYAAVVVIIVAFLLAFCYSSLKDIAEANERIDKKQQILSALNLRNIPKDKVESEYKSIVKQDMIIDANGNVLDNGIEQDKAGFLILNKEFSATKLPLYVCDINGSKKYVVAMIGKGLWGSIWGFIALNDDLKTVYGAYFSHESETAGLGALIKEQAFQDQLKNKVAYNSDQVTLSVVKSGKVTDPTTQCDGITGATLTSNGVNAMIQEYLKLYKGYFSKLSHNK